MSVWLLDVNVLVARFWEPHVFHRKVSAWMASHEREGWATCPLTQAGLVRTISNPGFSLSAPRPVEAIHWLAESLRQDPNHHFWPDNLPVSDACAESLPRLSSFKQLIDAYLLGLAIHKKARLLTLDRRMLALAAEETPARKTLVILE
jgi:toxin-antitoxin system PIN domain toxin